MKAKSDTDPIPIGWRELFTGDVLKPGDKIYSSFSKEKWIILKSPDGRAGDRYNLGFFIRKEK